MVSSVSSPQRFSFLVMVQGPSSVHPSAIFALVGIGHILDSQVIGSGSVLRTAVIFFYISNEGVSLMENAAHLGLPIPEKLKDVLEQLHDRAEKEEGKDE